MNPISFGMRSVLVLFFVCINSQIALAHGGGLDAQGGHNDRKKGTYHCHRAPCGSSNNSNNTIVYPRTPTKTKAMTAYDREDWPHWSDVDNDCMNTRHEMLLEQADGDVKLSPDGCFVSVGYWNGPFSGQSYTRASDLDVDHIVPLKWAHDHGGWRWSVEEKERFANDSRNLLVVDDGLNQSKGAKSPLLWMPPNQAFHCEYLEQWLHILIAYPDLRMQGSSNKEFMAMLRACN